MVYLIIIIIIIYCYCSSSNSSSNNMIPRFINPKNRGRPKAWGVYFPKNRVITIARLSAWNFKLTF